MKTEDIQYFYFDPKSLEALAEAKREEYVLGDPFPHIVIDNFLPTEVAERVLAEFPNPDVPIWHEYKDGSTEHLKLSCEDENKIPPFIRQVLQACNSGTFSKFVEALTGISGIIPDPHFRGGGLHQTKPGGFLSIHADFNHYKKLRLERRLNLLIYLNKDWRDEYGGHLELWDREMKECKKKVLPIFNRAVIFSTTDSSNHGHPDSLRCPPHMSRKSLALYYYTNGIPEGEVSVPHTTIFKEREGVDSFKKPSVFRRGFRKLRRMVGYFL